MENENKNCEKKGGCGCSKVLAIIAIILSVISIGLSAFTLGTNINNSKLKELPIQSGCAMQNGCPMQNDWQGGWNNFRQNGSNNFMPMLPMFNNGNRMNNFWQNNQNRASSSNAKRRIGGYSPNNKVYDKKPIQNIDDQSPKEYKTFDAPNHSYGIREREMEKQKKEQFQNNQ